LNGITLLCVPHQLARLKLGGQVALAFVALLFACFSSLRFSARFSSILHRLGCQIRCS
jgi:hypothetical protein